MLNLTKQTKFAESEEGINAKAQLLEMATNASFSTESSYAANADDYPDNTISFVDKHMNYLCNHPQTNVEHYLSNLRLMTRLR